MQTDENLLRIGFSQPFPDSPDGLRGTRIGSITSNIFSVSPLGNPLIAWQYAFLTVWEFFRARGKMMQRARHRSLRKLPQAVSTGAGTFADIPGKQPGHMVDIEKSADVRNIGKGIGGKFHIEIGPSDP